MRILVDTNILLRLTESRSIGHAAAEEAVVELRRSGHQLCIVPQVAYEFWSVATRPSENNGLGMNLDETEQSLAQIKRSFLFLRDERAVYDLWEKIVIEQDVKGKKVHDARLAAAMLRHGVSHLLTFNDQNFARFSDITVIAPSEAAALPPAG